MKYFSITLLLMIICNSGVCQLASLKSKRVLDSLLKRHIICRLEGAKAISDKGTEHVHNAANGYDYWVPLNFKEALSKSEVYSDTEKYVSNDGKCSLKIWPGKVVSFPLGQVDSAGKSVGVKLADLLRAYTAVNHYIQLIRSGKEKEVGGLKISEFCKSISGYNFQISLKGTSGRYGYIYKIELSELPVSGDLMYKHFLFKYDLRHRAKYEPLGLAMADYFGDFYLNFKNGNGRD